MRIRQRLDRLHAHPAFASAQRLVATLQARGFETVFAGGCVRDGWLGIAPKDLDLATAARPDDIEKAFAHTLAVGRAFGTMVVIEDGHNFEVTTFRKEGPYLDGRHPSQVEFSAIEEDARRRDFTVNALFYDSSAETVIDLVEGVKDLQEEKLRAVGDPRERFAEDHLRLLRAVRFVSQLGFQLDEATANAAAELAPKLSRVSAERVLGEMKRLLMSDHLDRAFADLRDLGLANVVWPEVQRLRPERLPSFVRWENAFATLMWLADSASLCETRLKAWKSPRDSQRVVDEQISATQTLLSPKSTRAQRLRALGQETYADTLILTAIELGRRGQRGRLDEFLNEYLSVANARGELPLPLLNGQDLIALGIAPGAQMGELLRSLYDLQLEGKIRTKDEALARIRGA